MTTHSIPVSTRVSHPATTPSIAPSYPLSLADQAAHDKASFVRVSAADALAAGWFPSAADRDSDPQAAKAYRRALRRSTAAVELIERDRQRAIAKQVEAAYAEYDDQPKVEAREYAASVAA